MTTNTTPTAPAAAVARLCRAMERIAPGGEARIDGRFAVGEVAAAQGDVYFRIAPPSGEQGSAMVPGTPIRLVPDESDGGRHYAVLDRGRASIIPAPAADGVVATIGPTIVVDDGGVVTIRHDGAGQHGPVILTGPIRAQVGYQRSWDAERREVRRSAD